MLKPSRSRRARSRSPNVFKLIELPGGGRRRHLVRSKKLARQARAEVAFAGILKCGVCGGAMTGEEHVKASGRQYVYYRCTRTRSTREKCSQPPIPEQAVIDQLAQA